MEQGVDDRLIETESRDTGPVVSATVARVMTTLLSAKPNKLQDAVSRLRSSPKIAPVTESLEQSLWFLHNYVKEAAERGQQLDLVILPIVQNSLSTKESKNGYRELILLNWLFQDEFLFEAIARNLASIILRRNDRFMALGWCIVGRKLIEAEDIANNALTAIRNKRTAILKTLCSCVPHLLEIVCHGSIIREGFELPTRLALAAADFVLSLTVALSKKELPSSNSTMSAKSFPVQANLPVNLLCTADDKDEYPYRETSELPSNMELNCLLWNTLNEIITLVKKITAWSKRSRFLHSEGSGRVFRWLQELRLHYDSDRKPLKSDMLLLASCWKHYGALLHLEDHKFSYRYKDLLQQYLSGIKFYADNRVEEPNMQSQGKSETINFFLNCLLLLFGRLDKEQFEDSITEFGSQLSQVLTSQLHSGDEGVIDGAVGMLKALIFGTNHTSSIVDAGQLDAFLPTLLNLLEERDAAAKAIVKLVAEYCSRCPDVSCLNEILKCLDSKNAAQRMNAFDVLSDLINISETSTAVSPVPWHDVANHLFRCLGDDDVYIQNQSANLISIMEPTVVLPTLVRLIYSTNEREQSSAKVSLTGLLGYRREEPATLCLLLDCASEFSQSQHTFSYTGDKQPAYDADRILKFISEWTKSVEYWRKMVVPLIDKMLSEPSNVVIVRFLSLISEYLAEAVDLVLQRLILHMTEDKIADSNRENCLFNHMCPLLVIRLLPLKVFDDLNSTLMYGELSKTSSVHEGGSLDIEVADCIVALILNRALSQSEFRDVRKLAAELCGRIHPEILIPVLCTHLESATKTKDVMTIKVCLFSLCTSLVVRGVDAYSHPAVITIKKTIEKVLSWSSFDCDEVTKAQHGCIDCLALMLCTEVQDPELSKVRASSRGPVLECVIRHLSEGGVGTSDCNAEVDETTHSLSFRLCMANVLISACQKIPDSGKKPFVRVVVPRVLYSFKASGEPEIKAACVQVLFSVAYHLKSWILLCSDELLGVALKSLREGSAEEKLAGAKLLASLMAGKEEVVDSISSGLTQAKTLLQHLLSSPDSSPDLQQILRHLVACFSSI